MKSVPIHTKVGSIAITPVAADEIRVALSPLMPGRVQGWIEFARLNGKWRLSRTAGDSALRHFLWVGRKPTPAQLMRLGRRALAPASVARSAISVLIPIVTTWAEQNAANLRRAETQAVQQEARAWKNELLLAAGDEGKEIWGWLDRPASSVALSPKAKRGFRDLASKVRSVRSQARKLAAAL